MEKSTNKELWVGYCHPVNKTPCVRWFNSTEFHTAQHQAELFIMNVHQCTNGIILNDAKTSEEAHELYGKKLKEKQS